jgi:glycosyltransferase involved in cell wall biosynthesis
VTKSPKTDATTPRRRILVVGSGTTFLSGISYYTHRLALALAADTRVSVLLMRNLLPRRLYPGRERVGAQLTQLSYPPEMAVCDGLDWSWGRSLWRTVRFLRRERPEVLVLQWWTGTVLHSYLLLAFIARRLGAPVVLEVHEAQDVGELGIPLAGRYVKALFPVLVRMSAAIVVHSAFDRDLIAQHFALQSRPVITVPHGPYVSSPLSIAPQESVPPANDVTRLLYFGVIRPFKGVEDLLNAFAGLSEAEAAAYHLTVVGETWEGWTLPAELIAAHPHRTHISFVNRYVSDAEVDGLLAATDGLVLPYHRSSSSGPLLFAIGCGLPVIVTEVGGLVEAAKEYEGAIFVPPHSPDAIRAALPELTRRRGIRYAPTASWETTRERYNGLFQLLLTDATGGGTHG